MESKIKIEDLRIGQEVWDRNTDSTADVASEVVKVKIRGLVTAYNRPVLVRAEHGSSYWTSIDSISLTPPKQKRRFWQWKILKDGDWKRTVGYVDDNGNYTGEGKWCSNWDNCEKIKIEDDYVEVEI